MSLLAMLKKGGLRQSATATSATPATDNPFIPPSVATVATVAVAKAPDRAANDPTIQAPTLPDNEDTARVEATPDPDPDRWCYPHSTAMTGAEIDTFTARLARFTDKGLSLIDGEALADKLVIRDRESDDRRLCLECLHLAGHAGSWRCGNWQAAQVAHRARDAQLPADFVLQLQRCTEFTLH